MGTPYVGFSNSTLEKLPVLKVGDSITCPVCKQTHKVSGGKDEHGKEEDLLLFYKCGDKSYLVGVRGKNILNINNDVSGSI